MNTPDHCSDDTIHRLVELGELPERRRELDALPLLNPADITAEPGADDWLVLRVHPSESLAEIFKTLALNGFGVYCVADRRGELCVAKTWRIEADKRRRAKERERARMTPAQLAADDEATRREQRNIDEMSRS